MTGSNAKFLSKDIITEFRGRGYEVHMYPLTFSEFMSVYSGDRQQDWRDYVLFGGIPLVLGFETADQKSDFLKSLFEETYISDITGRNNIRNKAELEELLNILSSAIGSLTNPSKLSATFKSVKNKTISKDTIIKYIDYLKDSFLERMAEVGMKSMSAFIRKMALNGYLIKLDLSDVKEVLRLLNINSNNLNQYSKRENETSSIYEADIKDLQKSHQKILKLMGEILNRLTSI